MEAWIVAGVLAAGAVYCWHRWRQLARAEFIRNHTFPRGLFDKVRAKRPELDAKQLQLVAHALRQFFLAYLHGRRRYVSMPSQVVDDLWHEFILYTRHYDAFCRRAFGGFLHHTPAAVLSHKRADQQQIALDAKLGIADGFVYKPDCSQGRRAEDSVSGSAGGAAAHCASHFSDTSYDGSTEGFGDFATQSSTGCGGDSGCGGGCGGGGD
jgi:hypothetical protein